METWYVPTASASLPDVKRVLVLAPHPDDEVFGCGGAIALYSQNTVPVHVHVLTDGAGYAEDVARAAIHETRVAESVNALGKLGSGISHSFANYQDRALLQDSGLVTHVLDLLEQHAPQLVFAPSPWEIHPDHQACARAAWAAVQHWNAIRSSEASLLMFYEVGSPLPVNMLLDITSVWSLKLQAMRDFSSQLQQQDYARHIEGLNIYRTYTLPENVRYAEAYHHAPVFPVSGEAVDFSSKNPAWLATHCMNHGVESVLQSASVHAEDLQRTLVARNRAYDELHEQIGQLRSHLEVEKNIHHLQLKTLEQKLQESEQPSFRRCLADLRGILFSLRRFFSRLKKKS